MARLKAAAERDLITILGRFPDIHAGQTLRLTGYWRDHPKYGRQFQVVHAQETKPATLTGLEKYLGSGLIKGIGPVTAKRIVAHFGLETLDIIEQSCSRLIEVPGFAQKRVAMIERAWAAQKAIKEVMIFLRGHGISTTYAVKIYKQYGDQVIDIVISDDGVPSFLASGDAGCVARAQGFPILKSSSVKWHFYAGPHLFEEVFRYLSGVGEGL